MMNANATITTLTAPFIGAGVALSLAAFLLAVRLFFRPLPPCPPLPEPDPCTQAARELDVDPDGGDDSQDNDPRPPTTITHAPEPRPAATMTNGDMLVEIGFAVFTRAEVEALHAIQKRWLVGAA